MIKPYKVRMYYITGINKGNVKSEIFFDTKEEAITFYKNVFEHDLYGYNPTVWEYDSNKNDYIRISY